MSYLGMHQYRPLLANYFNYFSSMMAEAGVYLL